MGEWGANCKCQDRGARWAKTYSVSAAFARWRRRFKPTPSEAATLKAEEKKAAGLYLIIMSFHIETNDEINCHNNLTVNNICFDAKLSSVSNVLFIMNNDTLSCTQNISMHCKGRSTKMGPRPFVYFSQSYVQIVVLVITKPPGDTFEQCPNPSNANRNK